MGLSRKYSSAEVQDFFAYYGTNPASAAAKYPELASVYENKKGDATNQVIYDIATRLENAVASMSEVNKQVSRTEIAIKRELLAIQEAHNKNLLEIIDEVGNVAEDIDLLPDEIEVPEIDTSNLDKYEDRLNEFVDNWSEEQRQIAMLNAMLSDSIVNAIGGGMEAFTDMLFGLEDAGMEQILAAFIAPFGDTLKQMGSMIMAEGIAMEAFKKSFSNPYAAIAAGAALIAVGSAVSSGLQKLTANPAGGAGSASYGGASSTSADNYESELTVNVVGHISGSDIALSLDRTRNKQRR